MLISKDEYRNRFDRVGNWAAKEDFDLLLVYTRGNRNMYGNLLYLTGYYSFDPCIEGALLVPRLADPYLMLNFEWDLDRAALTSWLPRQSMGYTRAIDEGLVNYCREHGITSGKIGIVGENYLPVTLYQKLQTGLPGVRFVHATHIVEQERLLKSENELTAMREAARITNRAIMAGIEAFQEGVSELDIFSVCVRTMLENQADEIAFTAQVSFGKNTEVCMAPASQNRLRSGDMVLFDIGCLYEHYLGDLSRTVMFGKPTSEQQHIYDVVVTAQNAAIAAVRPGVTAGSIDQVAREIISQAGYGECFNHWLGRGEGLDLHERPFIEKGDKMLLQPGMVFSIEPGIYLPGVGGARLEETVVVTQDGSEIISEPSWIPFCS
ncbi:MAG: Xaa-Pro peptidase family protein [Anaerolineales bacterium]